MASDPVDTLEQQNGGEHGYLSPPIDPIIGGTDSESTLVANIYERLRVVPPLYPECCIYRVPESLRKINEAAYTPQFVSIGPFHHGKGNLKMQETLKWQHLRSFIRRNPNVTLSQYVKTIKDKEETIRKCYAEEISFSSDEFVRMMLVDGCFILQYMFSNVEKQRSDNPWFSNAVQRDLILLENQLPLFVLEDLFELNQGANTEEKEELREKSEGKCSQIIKDLLAFVRYHYCCSSSSCYNAEDADRRADLPSIVDVRETSSFSALYSPETTSKRHLLDLVRDCFNPSFGSSQLQGGVRVLPGTLKIPVCDLESRSRGRGSESLEMHICDMKSRSRGRESESLKLHISDSRSPPRKLHMSDSRSPTGKVHISDSRSPPRKLHISDSKSPPRKLHISDSKSRSHSRGRGSESLKMPVCDLESRLSGRESESVNASSLGKKELHIQGKKKKEHHQRPHNVTALYKKGVKFEVRKNGKCLLDVSFDNGVLGIPCIYIQDRTESLLRNMIAFEQLHCVDHPPYSRYITDYADLLDSFIDTSKDVELLQDHGIIKNWLGDNEDVSLLFNKLVKQVIIDNDDNYYFYGLCKELNAYHRVWHEWVADLEQTYFNSPWTAISVIAAAVLIVLTILQTIYTVK